MAEADLVRPTTSYSGASGIQRRFLLSSPGRPRTATGHSEPKFTPTPPAGLAVRVFIKFQPSLDLTYERQYQTSHGFQPTDEICTALLRRLTHCSNELLTRRDSAALERAIPQIGDGKPLRFELIYQVFRGGPEPWVTETFKSYQRAPMDKSSATEIARSTDRIVGSFLKLHDKSFRWTHGKMRERSGSDLEILKPLSNPVSLLHVPQSRFIDATQDWAFVPGYEVTLYFRSRCKSRRHKEWQRTITLKSNQTSPLTLSHGEDMAWVLSTAMQRSLDAKKMAFDRQHRSCNRFDFLEECHHSEQNAVHVGFQIRNQLGLDHKHLRRELDSNLLLFQDPDGLDCELFVSQLEHSFAAVRDDTDKELSEMDDLRLTVYELSGRGWKAEKPFAICLDSTACYSRRTIKAILDRVQTGVADTLSGNDMSVTLMVHKRGHLVLDKTLVARSPHYATGQCQSEDAETVKENFLTRLKERLRSDIVMVVKDTCSLSDSEPQNIRVVERPVPAVNVPAAMEALPSSSPHPIPPPSGPLPDAFDANLNEPSEPMGEKGETLQNAGGVETIIRSSVIDTVGLPQQPETPAKATARKGSGRSKLSFSMTEEGETAYPSSSSTPSLIDGDIGTPPHESLLVTPTFMRTVLGHPQQFDANLSIAGSGTSDSELIGESLVRASTPTMQLFNGPRQFSLLGKGPRSISRQSLVSTTTESESEQRSFVESEPAAESEYVVVQDHEATSKSEPAVAIAMEGWLEYCCVPVDEEERPTNPEPGCEQEQQSHENQPKTIEQPVIVITPEDDDEDVAPSVATPTLEGFLEYAIETIVEEDEEDSDAEFHDAESINAAATMPSPATFATATENGLNSPISLHFAASTAFSNNAYAESLVEAISSAPTVEQTETDPVVGDGASTPVPTSKDDACTSLPDTNEPTPAPPVPETVELYSSLPEAEKPSRALTEPSEPRRDTSDRIRMDSSSVFENDRAQSESSEAPPRTPTISDSVPSISDKDEPREPSTPPPLMTETEDSDYSEACEPRVPFPDLHIDADVHDDSKSLSAWTPSRASFHYFDDSSSDSQLDPNNNNNNNNDSIISRKLPNPFPLLTARPSSSGASFDHRSPLSHHNRQFSSPTAGFFGFQEPRRLDIGLRGAVFGLALQKKQGKLERSSSQVTLPSDANRAATVFMLPGSGASSRRGSESRGIGGAGVLGLGTAYGF